MARFGLLPRLILLVLLAGLPAFGVMLHDHYKMQKEAEDRVWENVRASLSLIEAEQTRIIDGVHQLMHALALTEALRSGNAEGCQAFLAQLAPSVAAGNILHATDETGRVICSTVPEEVGIRVGDRFHIKGALAGDPFTIGNFVRRRFDSRPAMPFAVPYRRPGGEVGGAVAMTMEATWLERFVAKTELPEHTSVTMADRTGTVIARFPDTEQWAGRPLPDRYMALLHARQRGVVEMGGLDDTPRIIAYSPVPEGVNRVFLAVGYDKAVVLAPMTEAARLSLALIAASSIAALMAAILIYRVAVRRPVRALLEAASGWRTGAFAIRVPATAASASDLGQLALSFNDMAAELEHREADQRRALTALEEAVRDRDTALAQLQETMSAREAAEARFRAIVNTAVDAMVVIDDKGRIEHFNPSAERIFGHVAADVQGCNVSILMPEPDRSAHHTYLANYHRTGKAKIIGIGREVMGLHKDGTQVPLELSIAEWQVAERRYYTGIMRDISKRREVEAALKTTAERLRFALRAAKAGLWEVDLPDGGLVWSEESFDIFGIPLISGPITLATWQQNIHPEDREPITVLYNKSLADRVEDYEAQFRVCHPNRGTRWVAAVGRNTFAPDGTPLRSVGLNLDITSLKNAEHAAQAAREDAERANRSKSRFLAAASHDLRQPVQALVLMMDALVTRLAGHTAEPMVERMGRSLDALQMLLEGILDVSRLDAGVVVASPTSIALEPVLLRIGQEYGLRARKKGLTFRVQPCKCHVKSDTTLLERVLRNLLENALRYTDDGGVLIGAVEVGDRVKLRIADTGIGIAEDQQALIFQEFYQVGNPERDRGKGLGLGLSIVHRLVTLLRHDIGLSSVPGQGSVFTLWLPRAVPAASTSVPEPDEAPTCPGLIIVIDDEEMVRASLELILGDWGCPRVAAFEDGQRAAEWVRRTGHQPAAIVADYRLRGGRTGVNAIHEVQLACGQEIPAVIITGDTAPERIAEVERSGLAIAHKPVHADKLKEILAGLRKRA